MQTSQPSLCSVGAPLKTTRRIPNHGMHASPVTSGAVVVPCRKHGLEYGDGLYQVPGYVRKLMSTTAAAAVVGVLRAPDTSIMTGGFPSMLLFPGMLISINLEAREIRCRMANVTTTSHDLLSHIRKSCLLINSGRCNAWKIAFGLFPV